MYEYRCCGQRFELLRVYSKGDSDSESEARDHLEIGCTMRGFTEISHWQPSQPTRVLALPTLVKLDIPISLTAACVLGVMCLHIEVSRFPTSRPRDDAAPGKRQYGST